MTLTRRMQVITATGLLLSAAGVGYLTVGYLHFGKVAAVKQAEMAQAEMSNSDLRQLVAQLQSQLAGATNQLDATQGRLSSIGNQYGSLAGSLTATEQQLKDITDARDRLAAERDELEKRLGDAQDKASNTASAVASNQTKVRQLEKELQSANSRASEFKTSLEGTQKKLDQITAEREKATSERERLAAERDSLKAKLKDLQAALSKQDATGPTASAATGKGRIGGALGDLEKVVASTGLDVESVLARLGGAPKGEGGPYIALDKAKPMSPEELAKREETLRKLVKLLPLASPLSHYEVESPYGPRIDPINKREGFHPGVDLGGPFRSPVYSTGPGVVTFAGVRGQYGKFVEIDHGMGIVTHYAHLHRIMVTRGQKVTVHQQIGELGSTGRSTGPHLHYEVVMDGETLDPAKFLEAGKSVVQISNK
ncbi:MAG TPA: peptidoglycan DD-metalloendopeptidase family protein [Stellaceae bacterium]|nr:peptidoglycan DD-metalloendopeptidase family protein [Stellaceae bacterium]